MTLILPNGRQTFLDQNGDPISGGSIYSYVPGTTTPKSTYVDEGMTVPNSNPVILDQAGRCTMWGAGLFRQVAYDMFGNLQWDQETGFQVNGQDFPPNLTIPGNVTFSGPVNMNNTLTVAGHSYFNGGTSIAGGLTADTINTANLTATGTTTLSGTTNISGTFNMPEDIKVRNISPYDSSVVAPNFTAGAQFRSNPNIGPNDAIEAFGNIDIMQPGRYLRVQAAGEATLALTNLASGISWGITASGADPASGKIDFGFVDGQAAQIKNLMAMDIAGDIEITGNLQVDLNLVVLGTINGASSTTLMSCEARLAALETYARSQGATL